MICSYCHTQDPKDFELRRSGSTCDKCAGEILELSKYVFGFDAGDAVRIEEMELDRIREGMDPGYRLGEVDE